MEINDKITMKWIKTSKQLPENDAILLLYIVDNKDKNWWRVVNGSYHSKFYAHGGIRYSSESVMYWQPLIKP